MSELTTAQLLRIQIAVRNEVANKGQLVVQDRKDLPWYNVLNKKAKVSGTAGGVTEILLKKNGGLKIQHFSNYERLGFSENDVALKLTFPFIYSHLGIQFSHEEIENTGQVVLPNSMRDKGWAKPMSEDAVNSLYDLVKERTEDGTNQWDEDLDLEWHLDGSQDSKALTGLDGLLPLDPTTGTIGGVSRSNPLLQHAVILGSTTGAGGTIRRDITRLRRAANLNSRGRRGKVSYILAGADWIDGYTSYMEANGLRYTTDTGTGNRKFDIGMPDTGICFETIPVVHDPTFEIIDGMGYDTKGVPFTKRAYLLNMDTWMPFHPRSKNKYLSYPFDDPDRRFTRMSIDGRHTLALVKPNANAISSIA